MHRMNITMPEELARRLKQQPNKSAFIAQAVREKLDAEEKTRREAQLASAYAEAAVEDAEVAAEWDATSGDGL